MTTKPPSTYQTRIEGDPALDAYGELFGRVQRTLFADISAGRSAVDLKREYLERFQIPARLFNAARVSVEGKVRSVQEGQSLRVAILRGNIARSRRVLSELRDPARRHQKKRRLGNLQTRLDVVKRDQETGRVRVAFGSRKLWRAQFNLKANGCSSHLEWLTDWREARGGEFFVLGSKDETGGCQLCVATVEGDGSISLRLRLPDALAEAHGKHLRFHGLRSWRIRLVTYGKSSGQALALIGDAVRDLVESKKYARMLSSFTYSKVKAFILSRAHRSGVQVYQVNPAYSTVIGRVKFMERYGLTTHQAAALVLARRALNCSEGLPRRLEAPDGKGGRVTLTVPVGKRVRHVWSFWVGISGQLRPALAAQHRRGGPHRARAPALV